MAAGGRGPGPRLVALSGAAILAVYAAGYARTEAAERVATTPPAAQAAATPSVGDAAPATDAATGSADATAPATAAATPQPPASPYRDGTYVGTGYSRHGAIEATVAIRGGRIVAVTINRCAMRYPCSWIADLPAEVLARQSPDVDYVSGATDSSISFQGAIRDALDQARRG